MISLSLCLSRPEEQLRATDLYFGTDQRLENELSAAEFYKKKNVKGY